jgi:Flp pilus assembly protein TadG
MRPRRRDQRGAALVEFALVLPVLALFLFGVVDLGRAYRLKTQLANAAREGAAYAQYFPAHVDSGGPACADPENVVFVARNESSPAGAFSVTVTRASDGTAVTGCDRTVLDPGAGVVVKTSAPFTVLTPFVSAIVGSTLTLRASVQMVVQG